MVVMSGAAWWGSTNSANAPTVYLCALLSLHSIHCTEAEELPPVPQLKCLSCVSLYDDSALEEDKAPGCPSGGRLTEPFKTAHPDWESDALITEQCVGGDELCAFVLIKNAQTGGKMIRRMCGYLLDQQENSALRNLSGLGVGGACMEPDAPNRPNEIMWCFCRGNHCNTASWQAALGMVALGKGDGATEGGTRGMDLRTVQERITSNGTPIRTIMLKSVQTHRLSTPALATGPCAPPPIPPKRLSRTSSSLSSFSHQRLSCAPDDTSLLSMALHTPPAPALPPRPPTPLAVRLPVAPDAEDPLYEEIYSSVKPENDRARVEPRRSTATGSSGTAAAPLPDPPKLAPVSGVLHTKNPALVRPSAFRPFVRPSADATPRTPVSPLATPRTPLSPMATVALPRRSAPRSHVGKSLSDPSAGARPSYRKLSATHRSTPSQAVYYPSSSEQSQSSSSYGYGSGGACSDHSVDSWSMYGMAAGHQLYRARMIRTDEDECLSDDPYRVSSTPSPSDSGIATVNYESLLRAKDQEIAALRRTMELNEAVIFKVHEEKEAAWRKQLDSLRSAHDAQLHSLAAEQEAKVEELVRTNEELRQQKGAVQRALETRVRALEEQLGETQVRLDEASWLACEKAGQIALLKKQRTTEGVSQQQQLQLQSRLEQAQREALTRNVELKDLRQTLNFLSQELYQVQQKLDAASSELEAKHSQRNSLTEGGSEAERLRREVGELRGQLGAEQRLMAEERSVWAAEKEKVLAYQRTLQLTYLDVYRQKCRLESQLQDDLGLHPARSASTLHLDRLTVAEHDHDTHRESDC